MAASCQATFADFVGDGSVLIESSARGVTAKIFTPLSLTMGDDQLFITFCVALLLHEHCLYHRCLLLIFKTSTTSLMQTSNAILVVRLNDPDNPTRILAGSRAIGKTEGSSQFPADIKFFVPQKLIKARRSKVELCLLAFGAYLPFWCLQRMTSGGSVASDAEKLAKPVLLGTSVSLICRAWGNNRLSCNRPGLVHACMHS
eukprot:1136852-Pelagomonas_calceolata.AAC.2